MFMKYLATIMMAVVLCLGAWADENKCVIDGMVFKKGNRKGTWAELVKGEDAKGAVVIPAEVTIDGVRMPVEVIGSYAFIANRAITSVVFSDNIKAVWNKAFNGCENLKSVKLNEGLRGISDLAFEGTAIKEVTLPKSYINMSYDVFPAGTKFRQTSPVKVLRDVDGAKYYSLDSRRNLMKSPMVIVTHWPGCPPCTNAARAIYNFLLDNNLTDVKMVLLDPRYNGHQNKEWFEGLARVGGMDVEKACHGPIMYFVNNDGTMSSIFGFVSDNDSANQGIWEMLRELK